MSGGVRKIAQIAVGAVIGFAQGGPIGAAIGAGLAFYASEQQEKLNTKSPLRDNEPSAQTVRSSKAPARFILGRVSTGGVLVWAQEEAGAQRDGEWLHLVYVLCEGAVDALEDIYLGEELITTYGADASYELVVNPTQVNAFLKANCPDWKDEQIGRGLSFVRLSLRYNAEKFPSGIPDARFVVRGRNDLYDPRTGMAGYSENTALHILWFLRARCGVPDDEIVFETFASGANVCDESVANPDGTTSPRYRSSCVIGADEQRTNVLQKLEAACGGKVIRVGGRWMFQAGAYYGPWDFEITEDMVIDTITGSTEPTNDAAINTIRGTFTDTTQSWTETDYPEVSVAEWVVADGGEAAETLTFSYVTNPYQAQRLANIELRRRRAGGVINVPLNLLGYNCRPGRAVRANLPSLNILGEFIVTGWSMGTSEGCTASLQVYDPAIFDDAVGKPYNPIGFISMPSGGLGSPTGLAWTVDDTAEVTQGVLSWDAPVGIVTGYAVTVRQAGVAVQAQQVPETTLKLPLSGLPSGSYTMSVAAIGPLARSGEASITVNIDGPPVPEACVVTSTIESINLAPSNVQHGLNGGTYEYFYTMDPQAPVSQAEYLGQGLSLTHTGLAFFTNYYYFIRAKNAYGVSGYLKIAASTSTDVSTMLEALKGKIERGQIGPVLGEEIDGLQDQIDALDGLKAYDKNEPYEEGQMVVIDGRIYQAVHDVPADPSGTNAPPNVAFWIDVGQSIETANGLAQQVQTNTAKIEEVDGKATSTAESVQVLRASSRDDDAEGDLAGALRLWTSTAAIARESQVRTTETEALARSTETLTAQVGEAKSSIQRTDEVVAGIDGKVSAISSWKTETNVNGKKVATGIVQGSDGSVGQIIMSADQVVIANGLSGPEANLFVFQNGQMYVNTAFINSAFIQQLILGMTLRSQAVDSQGRPLIELNMVTGTFTLRGQDGNGSTLINNGGIYVYDLNNIERAALGRMT